MIYFCNSYTKDYNIITLDRLNITEFYLEKRGFGNLFFMAGLARPSDDGDLPAEFVDKCIETAEKSGFWEDSEQ